MHLLFLAILFLIEARGKSVVVQISPFIWHQGSEEASHLLYRRVMVLIYTLELLHTTFVPAHDLHL